MEQFPFGKILAVIVVSLIIAMSNSKNADIADIGTKLGLGLLGLGVIVFIFMKATGEI